MLVSLTVGKVDAGVAVLLTEDKRLIEFPSILLPSDIVSGSMVDIDVSRNFRAEQIAARQFDALQTQVYELFGQKSPAPPVLRCRNATQTSVVLEWDPIDLATAGLRCLSLYRNGVKAGNVPRDKLSTKISGLAIDTQYNFQLVLRTSAGTYNSEKLSIRTQKMTDLTGITITTGVMPPQLREDVIDTAARIQARIIDSVRIDTTHFVCTEGRGQAWEKALELNVPVVVPDWLKGCEREGRIVGVRGYYLDADPRARQLGPSVSTQQQQQQDHQEQQQQQRPPLESHERQSSRTIIGTHGSNRPKIEHTPPTPDKTQQDAQGSSRSRDTSPLALRRRTTLEDAPLEDDEADEAEEHYEQIQQEDDPHREHTDGDRTPESEHASGILHSAGKHASRDGEVGDAGSEASFATDTGGRNDVRDLPDRSRESAEDEAHQDESRQEEGFDEVDL